MNSGNYVENVLRTDSPITAELIARISEPETIRLLHAAMGLATESGEFMDMLKKHIFYGRPLDFVNAKEELGDTMWYVGLAIDVIRTTLDEVMTTNIKKLRLRYPEKFSEEKAHERNLEAERELLEGGYEDVSDKEYCAMNNLASATRSEPIAGTTDFVFTIRKEGYVSEKAKDWLLFSAEVFRHIEEYVVPQYGDKGQDPYSDYSCNEHLTIAGKYIKRFDKQARPGQEELDLKKIAHCTQMAFTARKETL